MNGLFGLIWVAFIVVTLVNSINNKNNKGQPKRQGSIPPITAKPVSQPAKPAEARSFQDWMNDVSAAQPAPIREEQMRIEDTLPPQPIAPRVHTHLSMDCDRDDPSGSMDFISTEGVDPCHDDDLPARNAPRPSYPAMQEHSGLALEWNGDALVRSVIMQEVLTRPCQRRRR